MNRGLLGAASLVPVAIGFAANFNPVPFSPARASARAATRSCAVQLVGCPEVGCAAEDSPDALSNALKRTIPTATRAKPITIDELVALQVQAERKVGSRKAALSAAQRRKLQNLSARGRRFSDGDLVSATGFIVGDPHSNKGESVNCNLRNPSNNDIHITIADEADADETDGFVAEMIPQGRPPEWSDAAVSAIARDRKQVLVFGQLFYDSKHRVNDDPENLLPGEPKRLSLFEIHPVTAFLVCNRGSGCDTRNLAEWTPLEQLGSR